MKITVKNIYSLMVGQSKNNESSHRGCGTNTAGTVNSIPLLKVVRCISTVQRWRRQSKQTRHRWVDVVFTSYRHPVRPADDVHTIHNGAGEAGEAGNVFSNTSSWERKFLKPRTLVVNITYQLILSRTYGNYHHRRTECNLYSSQIN